MVQRKEKKNRKYLGSRRWGAGNIKNNRGAGDRGGVGKGGKKGKFTYDVIYNKESLHKVGFHKWRKRKLKVYDLNKISQIAKSAKEEKPVIELRGYKILSSGALSKPAVVKASGFSKNAEEKIKKAGGDAVVV